MEYTYFDLLTMIKNSIDTDNMPEDVKAAALTELEHLFILLLPYSG